MHKASAPWSVRLAKASAFGTLAYLTLALAAGWLGSRGWCNVLSPYVALFVTAGMTVPTSWCRALAGLVLPEAIYTLVRDKGVLAGASKFGNGVQAHM